MSSNLKKVETAEAPKAVGPYSQGVIVNQGKKLIFVSGQLPIDDSSQLIQADIRTLTRHVINSIESILKAGNSSLQNVIRVDVFLIDLKKDFSEMNEEYAKRFNGSVPPVRQTIQVAALPKGSPIEISCIALVD